MGMNRFAWWERCVNVRTIYYKNKFNFIALPDLMCVFLVCFLCPYEVHQKLLLVLHGIVFVEMKNTAALSSNTGFVWTPRGWIIKRYCTQSLIFIIISYFQVIESIRSWWIVRRWCNRDWLFLELLLPRFDLVLFPWKTWSRKILLRLKDRTFQLIFHRKIYVFFYKITRMSVPSVKMKQSIVDVLWRLLFMIHAL